MLRVRPVLIGVGVEWVPEGRGPVGGPGGRHTLVRVPIGVPVKTTRTIGRP